MFRGFTEFYQSSDVNGLDPELSPQRNAEKFCIAKIYKLLTPDAGETGESVYMEVNPKTDSKLRLNMLRDAENRGIRVSVPREFNEDPISSVYVNWLLGITSLSQLEWKKSLLKIKGSQAQSETPPLREEILNTPEDPDFVSVTAYLIVTKVTYMDNGSVVDPSDLKWVTEKELNGRRILAKACFYTSQHLPNYSGFNPDALSVEGLFQSTEKEQRADYPWFPIYVMIDENLSDEIHMDIDHASYALTAEYGQPYVDVDLVSDIEVGEFDSAEMYQRYKGNYATLKHIIDQYLTHPKTEK